MNRLNIIIFGLLLSTTSLALDAKFVFIKGNVFINGEQVNKKEKPITPPYLIETGQGAIAVIKVNKVTTVKLNENSKIDLSQMKDKKNPSANLLIGSVFSYINKKTGTKKNFTLKAKNVAMGVRGTVFFTSFGNDDDLWMCVNEGVVDVTNDKGKKVSVKQGEGISANSETITDPKPLEWTKKLNWNNDPEKGDLKNTVSIDEAYTDLLDIDYD